MGQPRPAGVGSGQGGGAASGGAGAAARGPRAVGPGASHIIFILNCGRPLAAAAPAHTLRKEYSTEEVVLVLPAAASPKERQESRRGRRPEVVSARGGEHRDSR